MVAFLETNPFLGLMAVPAVWNDVLKFRQEVSCLFTVGCRSAVVDACCFFFKKMDDSHLFIQKSPKPIRISRETFFAHMELRKLEKICHVAQFFKAHLWCFSRLKSLSWIEMGGYRIQRLLYGTKHAQLLLMNFEEFFSASFFRVGKKRQTERRGGVF